MPANDLRDGLAPRGFEAIGGHYAIISESAVDFTDLVSVILPEFDESLPWGPCRWQARDAVTLPSRGDEAFVVFDNRRQPWILAWWPFS